MILAVTLPVAGLSSDDVNQNSTVSNEVTVSDINQDVKESPQELNQETIEDLPIVSNQEEPSCSVITECPNAQCNSEVKEPEIKEEANTCPCSNSEEKQCPVITEEPEKEIVCPLTEEQACSNKEKYPTIEKTESTCPNKVTTDSKCSGNVVPICKVKISEKVCPTKSTCPVIKKQEIPKPTCPNIITVTPRPTCPKIINQIPTEPEVSEEPVLNTDTPSVTPADSDSSVKITTVKLCKDNICTIGAAGNLLSIINYSNAKDPTYAELIAFLKSDKTDEIPYTSTFQCGDFAVLLHNNAEKAGIKAGWCGANGCYHAFNMFNTTDRGLVYIDCTGVPGGFTLQDKQLNVSQGQSLTGTYLFRDGRTINMGCTVQRLLTFW
jgi:hypothetical protein